MDFAQPLAPPKPITEEQYQEAVRLFNVGGRGEGRTGAYAFLYKVTGDMAYLIEAKVSGASGSLVGGPAWAFNGVLQSVMSQYPQDADAIKRFSIEIAAAALDAIVPDPDHPGMRIAPSELKAYDAAVAVWDRMQLAGVSPPAFMKAIRLALASNGDLGDALVAAAHNSAPTPNGIATGFRVIHWP